MRFRMAALPALALGLVFSACAQSEQIAQGVDHPCDNIETRGDLVDCFESLPVVEEPVVTAEQEAALTDDAFAIIFQASVTSENCIASSLAANSVMEDLFNISADGTALSPLTEDQRAEAATIADIQSLYEYLAGEERCINDIADVAEGIEGLDWFADYLREMASGNTEIVGKLAPQVTIR